MRQYDRMDNAEDRLNASFNENSSPNRMRPVTDNELPMRIKDLIDRLDPSSEKSTRESPAPDPMAPFIVLISENPLPIRAKPRNDSELLSREAPSAEKPLLNRTVPKTDRVEPILATQRVDSVLPNAKKSSTLIEDPVLDRVNAENAEPMRTKFLIDKLDPMLE